MDLKGINIGLAVTGSFCTFDRLEPEICRLIKLGANLYPIFPQTCRTRIPVLGAPQIL